jgi:hypothetical protein
VLILGLPRGGVPVAYEVAQTLKAPLDLLLVRKLGVPGHEELAMGAIAAGGIRVLNAEVIERLDIADAEIERMAAREHQELQRRGRLYCGHRPPPIAESAPRASAARRASLCCPPPGVRSRRSTARVATTGYKANRAAPSHISCPGRLNTCPCLPSAG